MRAAGSLGDVLTYQGRTGFRHVHIKARPTDPKSTTQTNNRLLFNRAVAAWGSLTDEEKGAYNIQGRIKGSIPGFNFFISLYMSKALFWTKFGQAKFGYGHKFGGP